MRLSEEKQRKTGGVRHMVSWFNVAVQEREREERERVAESAGGGGERERKSRFARDQGRKQIK
jgi:hypothetical protein